MFSEGIENITDPDSENIVCFPLTKEVQSKQSVGKILPRESLLVSSQRKNMEKSKSPNYHLSPQIQNDRIPNFTQQVKNPWTESSLQHNSLSPLRILKDSSSTDTVKEEEILTPIEALQRMPAQLSQQSPSKNSSFVLDIQKYIQTIINEPKEVSTNIPDSPISSII